MQQATQGHKNNNSEHDITEHASTNVCYWMSVNKIIVQYDLAAYPLFNMQYTRDWSLIQNLKNKIMLIGYLVFVCNHELNGSLLTLLLSSFSPNRVSIRLQVILVINKKTGETHVV